jgi:hypothetical protein
MDALREFLEDLKRQGLVQGNLLGFFHVLIGRAVTRADGTVISKGLTWRQLAGWLKKIRWSKQSVRELGLDPNALPPRDRQLYWYTAIARAGIDSPEARAAGERFTEKLAAHGYQVGATPNK